MKAIVPYKVANAKSRLSTLLTPEERAELARLMLQDITGALAAAGLRVTVLATGPFEWEDAADVMTSRQREGAERGAERLPRRARRAGDDHHGRRAADHGEERPGHDGHEGRSRHLSGRGGGTNAQLIRRPDKYHVDYYGASYLDHVRIAEEGGLSVATFDSFNMSTDIDETYDLVELYIHGKGESANYLRSFTVLDASKGRVRVVRDTEKNITVVPWQKNYRAIG